MDYWPASTSPFIPHSHCLYRLPHHHPDPCQPPLLPALGPRHAHKVHLGRSHGGGRRPGARGTGFKPENHAGLQYRRALDSRADAQDESYGLRRVPD